MSSGIMLIGCGKMGSALLTGWVRQGIAANDIVVVEPNPIPDLPSGVRHCDAANAVPAGFKPALAMLAVKPQAMAEVAPAYAVLAASGTCFLSIAAGTTIATLTRLLGGKAAVIRAMPNTPAAVGAGITVACAGEGVTAEQRQLCGQLLTAVGEVGWVDSEPLIDAVTAVSGSGPAYVFWLTECLAAAGEKAGLDAALAARLAKATVVGSGLLMRQSAESPAQLRRNVTSPNGTTQAALDVLMASDGLEPLMERAVAAAAGRAKELAG